MSFTFFIGFSVWLVGVFVTGSIVTGNMFYSLDKRRFVWELAATLAVCIFWPITWAVCGVMLAYSMRSKND